LGFQIHSKLELLNITDSMLTKHAYWLAETWISSRMQIVLKLIFCSIAHTIKNSRKKYL